MSYFVNIWNRIKISKPGQWFVGIFTVSVLVRLVLLLQPAHPWWDAAVYQGMARYIASGGIYGLWEFFRPPLWPLILSSFSGLGPIAQEWIAKILVVAASLVILYFVYEIGEKIKQWVGVVAAFLLSFSSPFLGFSVVPMTEIPSLFFLTLAVLLFINKKWFWAGMVCGFAFVTRFPTGILFVALGSVLLLDAFEKNNAPFKECLTQIVHRGLLFATGFFVVTGGFFISNIILYGNAFSPLIEGADMITGYLWLYQGDAFFYVKKVFTANPVILFIIPALFFFFNLLRKVRIEENSDTKNILSKKILTTIIAPAILFLIYFSSQAHKEFRYALPMYPFLFLMASVGIVWLCEVTKNWWRKGVLVMVAFCVVVSFMTTQLFYTSRAEGRAFYEFYSVLKDVVPGSLVVTSTPAVTAFSPVAVIEGYDTWKLFGEAYAANRGRASYAVIDTCELHACAPGNEMVCHADRAAVLDELSRDAKILYAGTTSTCQLTIYQFHNFQ